VTNLYVHISFFSNRPACSIDLPMPQFSPHQDAALNAVAQWLKAKPGSNGTPQVFRLFGYAGTGKTTLARHLADQADGEVKFAAFTGKAASVMRGKGCTGASTIHSLIYRARESGEEIPSFDLWDDAPASKAELIVIDECSMVDAEPGRYGETEVVRKDDLDPQRVLEADQVLVGRNATRRAYNIRMRERRGFEDKMPSAGDKLVCLRNNRKKGLFNGGLWTVKERGARKGGAKTGIMTMRLLPDDDTGLRGGKVSVRPECFSGGIEQIDWARRKPYDEFDYGYVLTVHKAQGSQWDDVVLFDESFAFPDSRERWLYTGVTRAAKRLTVVV